MAAETDDQKDDKPDEKSGDAGGGGMMKTIMLAAVCGACSFATVFFLAPSGNAESAVCTVSEHDGPGIAPLATEDQAYTELKEILITIGNEPATRYVKMTVSVITDKKNTASVTKAEPMLVDAFVTYLRSVELSDFENSGFYPRLRDQLARRAELVLGTDVSGGVLITEFLLR